MRPSRRSAGVSLVEALVALAVMAFGMLAVVGIQSTMRLNSDIAKQRSEAVRIAQETLEQLRAYSVLDTTEGRAAYADITTPEAGVVVQGYTTNTTYTLAQAVDDLPALNQKSVRITVTWADRTGTAQSVVLNTIIAQADPALFGVMATMAAGQPALRPRGRDARIPVSARDLGNGTSAFKPPEAGSDNTFLLFDNASGMITGLCELSFSVTIDTISAADVVSCQGNTLAHLLAGYIRFADEGPHDGNWNYFAPFPEPSPTQAYRPTGETRGLEIGIRLTSSGHPGSPNCYFDSPSSDIFVNNSGITYYCTIPANPQRVWGGFLVFTPVTLRCLDPRTGCQVGDLIENSAWTLPDSASRFAEQPDRYTHRMCRYTIVPSDADTVPNAKHPRRYHIEYRDPETRQNPIAAEPLINQNYLVIRRSPTLAGGDTLYECPGDLEGNFGDSSTRLQYPFD